MSIGGVVGGLNTASFGTPTRNNIAQIGRATSTSRNNPFQKPLDQMSDNEIRNLVQEYNTQLSQYQDKKVILDSMLCRLPEKPKTQKVSLILHRTSS